MKLVRKLKTLVGGSRFVPYEKPVDWQKPYETLRTKWVEVPITNWEILSTEELLVLPDDELLAKWEKSRTALTTGGEWDHRGGYSKIYSAIQPRTKREDKWKDAGVVALGRMVRRAETTKHV